MNETDREACLRGLAERMGLEEIPGAVADAIPADFLELAHAVNTVEPWEELESETRRLLGVFHGGRGAAVGSGRGREKREAPEEIQLALDPYTRRHGEVLADLAAARLDVRAFRRRHLQDRLLSDEEANTFLCGRDEAQRRLRRLSEDLERAYGWRSRRARRFVLTGNAPAPVYVAVATGSGQPDPVPISAEGARQYLALIATPGMLGVPAPIYTEGELLHLAPPKARITVEADAWVDAEEIARAFRATQRQLLGGSPRKRPERTLELVRFVAWQIREHGERPSWRNLRVRWNQKYPEWKYKYPRTLRETFVRFVRPKGIRRPKWSRRDGTEAE